MLKDCIDLCPTEEWSLGEHPRAFWRVVYHSLFYTHLYLSPDSEAFVPWQKHVHHAPILWLDDETGLPPVETTYSKEDLLEYLAFIEISLEQWIEVMDLENGETGFSWYPEMSKLEHQLVNLRHLGTHIGQLQERLYPLGIDPRWKGRGG